MCPEGYNHQAVVDFETNIISIHMPMRGTTNTRSGRRPLPHFNPRAHEGHDAASPCNHYTRRANFNPRAHEGHDTRIFSCGYILTISIHVPTRGTTRFLP